jgi:hypothetical protein
MARGKPFVASKTRPRRAYIKTPGNVPAVIKDCLTHKRISIIRNASLGGVPAVHNACFALNGMPIWQNNASFGIVTAVVKPKSLWNIGTIIL